MKEPPVETLETEELPETDKVVGVMKVKMPAGEESVDPVRTLKLKASATPAVTVKVFVVPPVETEADW